MKRLRTVSWTALALAGLSASAAYAQTAPVEQSNEDTIVVTGTRTSGFKASDSPAPIQVIGNDLLKKTGQTDLMAALAQNIPSIQVQAFGSDQTAFHPSVKLRGLNPNHALVLVNGKRRHGTASVAVAGGPFGGNASADLSFIPQDSIDHIEVLQDGAAAQYGTDAIAGVINIFLKAKDHGGEINVTGGKYFDQGGQSWSAMGTVAFAPIEDSYVDVTIERKFKNYSFRGDVDPRVVTDSNATARTTLANFPGALTAPYYPFVNRIVGDGRLQQTNAFVNAGYTGIENVEIYAFGNYGRKIGRTNQNYRLPSVIFGKNPTAAARARGVTVATSAADSADIAYPSGFQPQELTEETDYAAAAGVKGDLSGFTYDAAFNYGYDRHDAFVDRSSNAALYYDTSVAAAPAVGATPAVAAKNGFSPTKVLDGVFMFKTASATLDLGKDIEVGFAEPLHLAGGLEYRREVYELRAGEVASYYISTNPSAPGGGIQSFFGYSPANASSNRRNNFSQYLDVSMKPIDAWSVDLAARHEHYSDFGNTTIFKVNSRYDINDAVAIRGTVSTGFRAPTLAEAFYSGINVSVASLSGIFAPNSAGAKFLGLSGLKPEKSTNFSLGFVFKPIPKLTVTLDAYSIDIRNRIVQSGSFTGYSNNCKYLPTGYTGTQNVDALYTAFKANAANTCTGVVSPQVLNALFNNSVPIQGVITSINGGQSGSLSVQSFVNGVKTRTQGVDFLATYNSDFDTYGKVNWSLAANFNKTKVKSVNAPPANVSQLTPILDQGALTTLTNTTPKFRATAGAFWELDGFSVNLRESFYSKTSQDQTTPQNGNIYVPITIKKAFITDLEVAYEVVSGVKFALGANNLFNHYPTKYPGSKTDPLSFRGGQYAIASTGYITKYPTFSPFGINGGYYYGRVTLKF